MNPILEVDGLSISFPQATPRPRQRRLTVIRDLSLTIAAGQILAVVGASGSGKSLLAHSILGILPDNSRIEGRMQYCGMPLTQARKQALRGREMVLVPQGVSYLDPLMKVGPQIRRGSRALEARNKSRTVLDRYGLGPETEKLYPFELSGGMARRIMIATAVMETPKLVVADEPTPGLDALAAKRILGHFRELADAGAGVLFITHDLELALVVADRVLVLYAGETIEEAAAEDFTSAALLRHPYTRSLWNAMPQHGFVPILGAQPYPGDLEAGCLFAPRCPLCRPACRSVPKIAYRPFRGGYVRCLLAENEGTLCD